MNRLKTYDATGVAPNGRLFAGDLNALQDAVAALTDLTQPLSVASVAIGESGLLLSRFGAGEAQLAGSFRTSGIFRGLGGLIGGSFSTTARDAIVLPPFTLVIFNTTTNRYEWNSGTTTVPNWQPLSPPLGAGSVGTTELAALAVTTAKIADGNVTSLKIADATITGVDLAPQSINTQAASYSLVAADRFKLVQVTAAGANTVTVPTDASQAFSPGESVDVIQWGAGQITFTPAAGVTLVGNPGLKSVGQYTIATLVKIAANSWVAVGALTP